MKIKSYFADSVQEAIEKARIELGPEAMLMNSKKTDFELRALGSFEVVLGLPGQAAVSKPRLQVTSGGGAAEKKSSSLSGSGETHMVRGGEVVQELAELRRQIETVKRSLNRKTPTTAKSDRAHSHTFENVCARLLAADISEDLALQIAEAVELQAFAWKHSPANGLRDFDIAPSESIELALSAELDQRVKVSPELGIAGKKQKVAMFVGPPGAGKTTSLIKLGLRCGIQAGVPMHILSLDTFRVGGWEHLAAYARIAGLEFDAVHNLASLEHILSQQADKKLILIDTPGLGPSETDDLNDLSKWLKRFSALDVHLVIPATLRSPVFCRILETFSILNPGKLLLTRADEVESRGILLDLAIRSRLPISYISNGQTIPENIEQASRASLFACLGNRSTSAKQEAA